MNDHQIIIYCLNRAKDHERKAFMFEQLKKTQFPYEFIAATEAKDLKHSLEQCGYDKNYRKKLLTNDLKRGEVAHFLSYKKIMQLFIQSQYEYCVILEDDALIADDFDTTILQLMKLDRNCYETVKLESRSIKGYKVPMKGVKLIYPLKSAGTTGIFFHQKAVKKILPHMGKFFLPTDIHLGLLYSYGVRNLQLQDPVIKEYKEHLDSTIGTRKMEKKFQYKVFKMKHSISKRIFFIQNFFRWMICS